VQVVTKVKPKNVNGMSFLGQKADKIGPKRFGSENGVVGR
jgi:hypothetical protein